jgi:hypothetical protein
MVQSTMLKSQKPKAVDVSKHSLASERPMRSRRPGMPDVKDLTRFEGAYGKFLLYSGGSLDWLTGYLTQKGYQLRLLSSEVSGEQIYQIYLVSR